LQTKMPNCNTKSRRNQFSAFTLLEITIVVSLVGILVAIALPNLIRTRAAAAKSSCLNNLRQIDSAIQQWAFELKKNTDSPVSYSDISPYLKDSVTCPSGGISFVDSYTISTVGGEPMCQRSPVSHLLPLSGLDRVSVSDPTPPGDASGSGSVGRPGPPSRPEPPSKGPPDHPTPPPHPPATGKSQGI
jgi:type II secretory pathway pseudopilin PulG